MKWDLIIKEFDWISLNGSEGNVFLGKLPLKKPNLQKGIDAKTRSIHNNYITLPVLFIMISAHFPFTYGHKYNWLILCMIGLISVSARHYFNLRGRNIHRLYILISSIIAVIVLAVLLLIFKN